MSGFGMMWVVCILSLWYNINMVENPVNNLSNSQLRFSYWYISHKLELKRWLAVGLAVVAALFWFYVIWQVVFGAINFQRDDVRLRQLIYGGNSVLPAMENSKPQSLQLSPIKVFSQADGRYDFLAQVANPNAAWLATFDYQFKTPPGNSLIRKGFALPGETKNLMDLGIKGSSVQLEITNQKWIKYGNFSYLKDVRHNFVFDKAEFIAGAGLGEPDRLVFELANKSPFGYWQFGVQALLYSGSQLVSINYLNLEQLKSGESRRVELFWHESLPAINNFEIKPDVNILDEDNIMPPVSQ